LFQYQDPTQIVSKSARKTHLSLWSLQ